VLPLAWFYITLVAFLYALLFLGEMKARAKRHVKGCPSLPYISPARLDSLIAIEPDLFIIELSSRSDAGDKPRIPDALRVPISQLERFLQKASRRSVFVFYDSATEPVTWPGVECMVNNYAMRNVFVLKGGLELWLSKHQPDGTAVAT
jgi:3-mercaptopyruvate sulfurtransferase SseA